MAEKVLIPGGSGLIGRHLCALLKEEGFEPAVLSRSKTGEKDGIMHYQWNPAEKKIDAGALDDTIHIINLAGRNLFEKRWNEDFKNELFNSRVDTTKFLAEKVKKTNAPVKTWINASGINFYGADRDITLSEESNHGNDFLSRLCREWERAAERAKDLNIRTVIFRFGVVLADKDSALQQMELPVKMWAGAPISPGSQFMSWIHITDLCRMMVYAIQNHNVKGTYNAVAPNPVTNKEMTNEIASIKNKPIFLPSVPQFMLKLMLGEVSQLVTGNLKVSGKKIQKTGFQFYFANVNAALSDLLTSETSRTE